MKTKNYHIYIIAALTFLGACKAELNLAPTDVIASTNAFQSLNDIQRA